MKLCQIVAIVTGRKVSAKEAISKSHQLCQKPELFNGLTRTYTPKEDGGETYPPENKLVVSTVQDQFAVYEANFASLLNAMHVQELGNTKAVTDVVVDGTVVVKNAPISFLLALEKQLVDMRTYFTKLPVLDVNETWMLEPNTNKYVTVPVEKVRTKKVEETLVLYPATKEHPAQTKSITKDVIAGTWTERKISGAIPVVQRDAYLRRIEVLIEAVKTAREGVNGQDVEVSDVDTAQTLLSFVINGK